ncbi:MAG: sigma 54-interacting transcriptional regulator [Desulfobacteraceae bacterium]
MKIPVMDTPLSKKLAGRLIVVDEDAAQRQVLEATLTRAGYEVRFAPSASAALLLAQEDPFDLILLDSHAPDLAGLDTCRCLRQDAAARAIPVIFSCGLQDRNEKIQACTGGGAEYITKPHRAEELLQRVKAHICFFRLQNRPKELAERRTAELSKLNARLTEANRRLELEIAQRRQTEAALSERLRFEGLLSDLSARFVNLPAEGLDREIERALEMVMAFFQVDRCALVRTLPGKTTFQITHVAASPHAPPVPKGMEIPRSENPWAYRKLVEKGEVVAFTRMDEVPEAPPASKQFWRQMGIRSTLSIPILLGESVDYVITINAVQNQRVWPEEFIPRLQLLGEVLVNAVARRNAKQALRESEERLSLAAASAEAGFWVLDPSSGGIWASDRLRVLLGFAPNEAFGLEQFMALVLPEDREIVEESIRQCLERGTMINIEYRIQRPPAETRWFASRGRSYSAAPELPARLMGVSLDITARKAMEGKLREQLEEIGRLKRQLEQENRYLQNEIVLQHGHDGIVGRSPALKRVLAQVEQVAGTDASVLLLGETGTGKELLARTIHSLSQRKDRPLVTINCAVLPPTLIESELFGREKGAYTGALTRMAGRFEVAHRSTLFLDEIAELPLDLQAKLLRVLEDGRFERLGSSKPLKVDVRIIAATNRDLVQEVAAGRFRSDLYYRLSVFPIAVPPLRERPEDIPPLVWAFVRQNEKKLNKPVERIDRRSMEALTRYSWPGNARELRNIVEHAMITSGGGTLHLRPPDLKSDKLPSTGTLAEVERRYILDVLSQTGWRITGSGGAAEILGLKRTTLQSKMKRLGIRRGMA